VVLASYGYFAPRKMDGVFNIAVAEFGETGPDGQIRTSKAGQQISGWAVNSLRDQLKDDPNLLIWPNQGNLFNRTHVALAKPETAETVAQDIHASMLLYGYVETRASPPQLVLKSWIAPQLKYRFEDIQGSFSVGNPIRVADLNNPGVSVQGEIERQSGALAWVGMGLTQEQLGQTEDALKAFQRAEELAPQSEVIQFFLGREYLFLSDRQPDLQDKDWQAAEDAFQKAISLNDGYARAYIGLGGVYSKRAANVLETASDPDQIAASKAPQWVQKSVEAFQTVLDLKPNSEEYGTPIQDLALLSLGDAYRLKGVLASDEGDQTSALDSLKQALATLEKVRPAFEESVKQHESYRRYLAQVYEHLGETYQWQGYVFGLTHDIGGARDSYRKSLAAYTECIAQGDPKITSDLIIQNDIVGKFCQPYYQETKQSYDAMNGGP